MPLQLVVGTAPWNQDTSPKLQDLHAAIRRHSPLIKTLDTAARYGQGASEKAIGAAGYVGDGYQINTKVLFAFGGGCHSAEAVETSILNSLASLGMEKVNVLYAHGPDKVTPIEEQAKAFDAQFRAGRFAALGVSNFNVDMLQQWIDVADKYGYVKPSIFQGQYNILCRGLETTILPILRSHKIQFTAYSPLAGSFLSGKPTLSPEGLAGTRFDEKVKDSLYGNWYNKPSMHAAVRRLNEVCEPLGLSLPEVAMRWLVHHSALGDEDSIIIGPGSAERLEQYVDNFQKGELPEEVVREIENLWEGIREDAVSIVTF